MPNPKDGKMKLSKENYDLLDENFLYKCEPVINNSFYVGATSGTYHCKNWTFIVKKRDDKAWMCDTYFKDHGEELTDENIGKYEKVFDFREMKQINDDFADEYEDSDKVFVATGSGGYSCGGCNWVKKTAIKSQRLLVEKSKKKIQSLELRLEREKNDLVKFKNGTAYEFKFNAGGDEVTP